MFFRRTLTAGILKVFFITLIMALSALSMAHALSDARLTFIKGEVKIAKGGFNPISGKVNETIAKSDFIATGGNSLAEIASDDGTIIRLASNTMLRIEAITGNLRLERGVIFVQLPQTAINQKITTEKITFETENSSSLVEYTPGSYAKFVTLSGTARAAINTRFGEWITMDAGKMLILRPDSLRMPDPVDVDLNRLVQTSGLINRFGDERPDKKMQSLNVDNINNAIKIQQKAIISGDLVNTNLLILSRTNLIIASDELLKALETRSQEILIEKKTSEPLPLNQGSPFILDAASNMSTSGTITRAGALNGIGQLYQNYEEDINQGGYANYIFGRQENAFEKNSINFNRRFASLSPVSTFLFNNLEIQGNFGITTPAGTSDKLSLAALYGIDVTQPVGNISANLSNLNLITANGSININNSITASIAPKSPAELAMETQSIGQYIGVDNWQAHNPLPTGTIIVNGANYAYGSLTSAASEYFAPDAARNAAKTGAGGTVNAKTYFYAVQVGPYRDMSKNPPDTPFHYSNYVARYEVTRPLPIAYSLVENNPQFGSGLTGGQPTIQYRALFNRADLVRLGYLKIITYDANDPGSLNAEIKPFSDYATTYISSSDLENKVKESWEAEMAKRTPEKQAEAQKLINEAKAVQDRTSNRNPSTGEGTADSVTTRSYQEFFAYARGAGSNLNLAAGKGVAGFGKVTMAAEGNIDIKGEVAGAENFYGIGLNSINVADGGLIEVFTDNRLTGGGTIELSAQNKIEIGGRVQASATPQNYFNRWQKAGSITLNNGNTDPDSIAIEIKNTGQILALINSASYTKADAGRTKVDLTSAGGRIKIDGLTVSGENYGKNIVADYGDLNIVNNGTKGVIDILSGAGLQADIMKIGALGTEGVLNIYAGSRMDANTQIKLFGGQLSGGAVVFGGSGNVYLTSPAILISADKVQVNTGVNVNTGAVAADVYANKRYWTPVQGGDAGSPQLGTWSTTPNNKGAPLNPSGNF
ncbi:MAG TPA: hypothetical protein PKW07_06230 [Syntrophorhabdaceae bacterium]|nr:hypothetical protein [Syntrophorhabdaceae bacterium]